jgi:hypothetical protein
MPTYYRPTKHRGNRLVYKSTDPDEPKRDRKTTIVVFSVLTFSVLVAPFIAFWMK